MRCRWPRAPGRWADPPEPTTSGSTTRTYPGREPRKRARRAGPHRAERRTGISYRTSSRGQAARPVPVTGGGGRSRRMSTWETLPAQFNVATWFVDRNVAQGRGASPAFHYEDRTLTYADVQDLANRTGNALRELGVQMEDRALVLCLDAPEVLG